MVARLIRASSLLCRSLGLSTLVAMALLLPAVGLAQEEKEDKPAPEKEWVLGYAAATLPMAAAMFFMFRMSKRHEFKVKKDDSDA